ncbi:BnaAnng33800D, partial [Brassica napus]
SKTISNNLNTNYKVKPLKETMFYNEMVRRMG